MNSFKSIIEMKCLGVFKNYIGTQYIFITKRV